MRSGGGSRTRAVHSPAAGNTRRRTIRWTDDTTALLVADPPPEVTGWERVEIDGRRVTLEPTGRQGVLGLVAPNLDPARLETVNRSEARAVGDTGRRTLAVLNITADTRLTTGTGVTVTKRYTFEHGTDIRRPDSAGPPLFEEHVWRLLLG